MSAGQMGQKKKKREKNEEFFFLSEHGLQFGKVLDATCGSYCEGGNSYTASFQTQFQKLELFVKQK